MSSSTILIGNTLLIAQRNGNPPGASEISDILNEY